MLTSAKAASPAVFKLSPAPQLERLTMDDVRWAAAGGFARAPEHHVYDESAASSRRATFRWRGSVDFSFSASFRASLRRLQHKYGEGRVGELLSSASMSNTVMHSTTPADACTVWFQGDAALDQDTFRLTDLLRREVAESATSKAKRNAHVRNTIKMPRQGCGKIKGRKRMPYHPLQQIMTFGSNARPAHQVNARAREARLPQRACLCVIFGIQIFGPRAFLVCRYGPEAGATPTDGSA